jgi:hypothetical protein
MLCVNALIMGLTAVSFSRGPYSSWGQELGYRYYSIGFLLVGAILPAIALGSVARRWAWTNALLTAWMFAAFVLFMGYIMQAGGGV